MTSLLIQKPGFCTDVLEALDLSVNRWAVGSKPEPNPALIITTLLGSASAAPNLQSGLN